MPSISSVPLRALPCAPCPSMPPIPPIPSPPADVRCRTEPLPGVPLPERGGAKCGCWRPVEASLFPPAPSPLFLSGAPHPRTRPRRSVPMATAPPEEGPPRATCRPTPRPLVPHWLPPCRHAPIRQSRPPAATRPEGRWGVGANGSGGRGETAERRTNGNTGGCGRTSDGPIGGRGRVPVVGSGQRPGRGGERARGGAGGGAARELLGCCAPPHPHHGPEPPLSPTVIPKLSELGGAMAAANRGSKAKAGAVRFAPSQPSEGNPGHVHFDEKLRDSAVMVTQERDGHVLVKVGFLKILHKYEITFLLPPSQRLGRDVCALPLPNPNLKVLSVTAVPEGYSVRCEYTAHKEGVLKEEMLLASETGDGSCLKVVVQARVMDRHHGTPMLLDGVRCVGAELEYDSEQSDWHGFD